MSRRIITKALQSKKGGNVDKYTDRVIKYIPGDVVGAWIAVLGLVKSVSDVPKTAILWWCFAVAVIITAVWTLIQTHVPNERPAIVQTLVSTFAFVVWVFGMGDPFTSLNFYHPIYGSLAIILFTLISGRIVPPK
jgi:uncharacterized BrkB/YihY/UPF0761 family membrane protein